MGLVDCRTRKVNSHQNHRSKESFLECRGGVQDPAGRTGERLLFRVKL